MPHYFAAGDHRSFIIDYLIEIFMGDGFILIIHHDMRRLTLSQQGLVNKYLEMVNSLFQHHHINKKIDTLKSNWNKLSQSQKSVTLKNR